MHITLVISSLSAGGAERVMSTMANYWAKKGWEITLITLDSNALDFYDIHPNVKRIALDLTDESNNPWQAIKNNLNRIKRLRRRIKAAKPDVVISFVDRMNVLTLLATRGLGLNVIISERTDPTIYNVGRVWHWLRKTIYPLANSIVAQSTSVGCWLEKNVKNGAVTVIPNPINYVCGDTSNEHTLADIVGKNATMHTIIAMGRLSREKGFDLLLKSFARITNVQSAWSLVIFGEGDERNSLARLAEDLGIADRVFFPGAVKNPTQLMRQADVFVLSSRFEGFPNALCEAMACGLPVISFDCPSGPREIIRDGVDGILVPAENVDALSEAMKRVIENDIERNQLAERAPEIIKRLSLENIMERWENLIFKLSGQSYA